jgi:hypothetical protein
LVSLSKPGINLGSASKIAGIASRRSSIVDAMRHKAQMLIRAGFKVLWRSWHEYSVLRPVLRRSVISHVVALLP